GAARSALASPHRRIPQVAAQQADLSGVQHLVLGAPQERLQFRRRKRVRVRHGLIEFCFAEAGEFLKHLLMYTVQHRPKFAWRVCRISLRHRVRPEQTPEVGREEFGIAGPLSPDGHRARRYSAKAMWPTCQATWLTPPAGSRNQSSAGVWSSSP